MQLLFAFVIGVLVGMLLQRRRGAPPAPSSPAPMRDVTDHEIEELLRRGQRIEAIRRYRELHGCDVARATQMVDTLERILRL